MSVSYTPYTHQLNSRRHQRTKYELNVYHSECVPLVDSHLQAPTME